jgi:hypothetical protein
MMEELADILPKHRRKETGDIDVINRFSPDVNLRICNIGFPPLPGMKVIWSRNLIQETKYAAVHMFKPETWYLDPPCLLVLGVEPNSISNIRCLSGEILQRLKVLVEQGS